MFWTVLKNGVGELGGGGVHVGRLEPMAYIFNRYKNISDFFRNLYIRLSVRSLVSGVVIESLFLLFFFKFKSTNAHKLCEKQVDNKIYTNISWNKIMFKISARVKYTYFYEMLQ